jgi:hypothetical protein
VSQSKQMVTFNVLLAGVIAYVPEGDTLWALMPNALLPTPARWGSIPNTLPARSPHTPFLLISEDLIQSGTTKSTHALIDAFFRKGNASVSPQTVSTPPPATAAIVLLGEQLDFGTSGTKVEQDCEVLNYVPRMSVISPKHRYASHRYRPGSADFNPKGLSAAFHLTTGCLKVHDYFGDPEPVESVPFGYVHSCFGKPLYLSKVWNRRVANQLMWTFQRPPDQDTDQDTVTIKSIEWGSADESLYVLKVPHDRVINMAIMHSEVDVAALFRSDTTLPEDVEGIPDPDFEIFYGISTRPSRFYRWRVPVPPDQPAGAEEKPCSGTYFERFG